MNLKSKVAIVTGASKGIGLAVVKSLLERECKVAGWSRSNTPIQDPNFKSYKVDVQDPKLVENGFGKTVEDFGSKIPILINNAGLGYEGPMENLSLDHWQSMFKTNVDGIFYCTKHILPLMKAQGNGHIINISSIAGTTGIPGMVGYCATKYAVRGLSHALFKEVRNFGIKVTCIYPGSVKTNFFDDIASVELSDKMMKPEDIASTILHCLSASENYHHVDIEVRPLRMKG